MLDLASLVQYIERNPNIKSCEVINDMMFVFVDPDNIIEAIRFLKNDNLCCFGSLMFVFAIDYPKKDMRFEIVYSMLSFKHNRRVWVKSKILFNIRSIVSVFPVANWFEREIFDMYGIEFLMHPNLKRIFSEDDFDGFPMRKDFPLSGHYELYYSEIEKKVIKKPVEHYPSFRFLNKQSPWQQDN